MSNSTSPTAALEILQTIYGYDDFRGQQLDIVDSVIAGNDALVLMPTGGGKSLCYQIPALARSGTGVVVSPLIALMQDQVDALRALDLNAVFINSSLDAGEINEIQNALLAGDIDMLYVAPERLLMPGMLDILDRMQIALFAIDEAHCVSQWGHDFRREYLGLSLLAERYPEVPRMALTATADERTREEIVRNLQLEQASRFVSSFDRPNIRYTIGEPVNARDELLAFIKTQHSGDAGIVYCLSRKKVEQTAEWLNKQGIAALPYHAGLSSQVREKHQNRFLREDGLVVVATIAFGMGIDKPDVRFVAHLNLPKSIEAYYQETGRAGRDGLPSNAWMAYGLQDVINLRSMMSQSDADEKHKRLENHKLDSMLALAELTNCRRQALLSYFGDDHSNHCGNCDNCLYPPQSWDATEAARKALSCVYRTGQRFGVTYLIDVLLGKRTDRIIRTGHDQQTTFGIGTEHTINEWRNVFRQLIAKGYLAVDVEGHGSVKLTEHSRPLLRGDIPLFLRQLSAAESKRSKKSGRSKASSMVSDQDQPLWEALRGLRKQGQHKLEQYGEEFLEVIKDHC